MKDKEALVRQMMGVPGYFANPLRVRLLLINGALETSTKNVETLHKIINHYNLKKEKLNEHSNGS